MNAHEAWSWFRTTLYSIGDGVITADTSGAVLQMNPTAEMLTGWSEADALGRPIQEVFHIINETSRTEVENPIVKVIGQGLIVGLANHTLLISRDGTERPIADSGAPIRDDDGKIIGAVLVFSDRSEQRQAEYALRRERDRAQQYLDIVGTAIVAINADQTVGLVNQACCQLLGYNEAEILGTNWFDNFLPEGIRSNVKQVFSKLMAGTATPPEFVENLVLTRSGEVRTVIWHNAVLRDEAGNVTGTLSAGIDITDRKSAEQSLRQSEQQFRDLAEGMDEVIWLASPDRTRVLYVNKVYEQVWGRSREELYHNGLAWLDAVVAEDRPAVLAHLNQDLGVDPQGLCFPEYRISRPDGGIRSICARTIPIHDTHCNIHRIAIVAEDVTDQRQARGEREAIVAMSRMFLSSASLDSIYRDLPKVLSQLLGFPVCAIARHDSADDRVIFLGVHGLDTSTQLPHAPSDLTLAGLVINSAKPFVEADCYTCSDPVFDTIKQLGLRTFLGVPIVLRDRAWGTLIVADSRKRPHARRLVGTLQVLANHLAQEIGRYQAERIIKDREAELSAIYDYAPLMMLLLDGKSKIRKVNRRAAEFAGIPAVQLLGRHAGEALRCPHALADAGRCGSGPNCKTCRLRQALFDTIETGTAYQNMEMMLPLNGQQQPTFLMSTMRFNIVDEPAVLVTMLDISDRKQVEQERAQLEERFRQAQKMESVGRLAGGVAHDFNNALQVIQGHAELALAQLKEYDPLIDDICQIRHAADRSADLTRQLLGFARKQPIKPRKVNLNDFVGEMQRMLRRLVGENIELTWSPGSDLWDIQIDPTQVDQILANLIVNARDAICDTGRIAIETANAIIDDACTIAHPEALPGEYAMLIVSDNGMGMSREATAHLFEPFYTTKPAGKGTGLGLATVYGIVKQNGGFINVYSEAGQGTTFKIYFPRLAKDVPAEPLQPPTPHAFPTGTETLLLVEDEPPILQLGRQILEQHGYKVLSAQTPAEALSMATQYSGDIHMLITDIVMPGMNGKELKDRLTAMRPGLKSLFISGYTADLIAHSGMLNEGVQLLQKPFSIGTLTQKVRDTLHQQTGQVHNAPPKYPPV